MISQVGKMRERVAIYLQTQTVNDAGEITTSWDQTTNFNWASTNNINWGDGVTVNWAGGASQPLAAWARVEPMSASSLTLANRDDAQRFYKMTTRYRTDITTNSRIIWRDRKFDVTGVIDETEQRQFLTIYLKEINA
jgi:SPP1 family predicted phage head-tail adaptor